MTSIFEAAGRRLASIHEVVRDGRILRRAGEETGTPLVVTEAPVHPTAPFEEVPQEFVPADSPMAALRRENDLLLRELETVRREAREDRGRSYERERELLEMLKASYRLLEDRSAERRERSVTSAPAPSGVAEADEGSSPIAVSDEAAPAPAPAASAGGAASWQREKTPIWRRLVWLLLCVSAVIAGGMLAAFSGP